MRPRLTLEEAERGVKPEPLTQDEWGYLNLAVDEYADRELAARLGRVREQQKSTYFKFMEKHRVSVEWRINKYTDDWVCWLRFPWGKGEHCACHGFTLEEAMARMIEFTQIHSREQPTD